MNDIVQMSKGGAEFYPQTHVQAVLGLNSVGTNLYTDTRDFDNPSVWTNWSNWSKTGDKFNGLTVMSNTVDWNGLGQTIQAKKGETYTFSLYARYQSGTGKSAINFYPWDSSLNGIKQVPLNETWQRVSMTVTMPTDGSVCPRIERSNDNKNTLLIAGIKLEKGPTATDWCLNPLEIATDGSVQTAITNALGKVATINVISQADYDKLADKTGIYFIKG